MRDYHSCMSAKTPAHPKHELAQAVFRSVYNSHGQRQRRWLAALLLAAKHTLRGLLFSWPLYLMALGGFYAPFPVNVILWAIAVPGMTRMGIARSSTEWNSTMQKAVIASAKTTRSDEPGRRR